VEESKDGKEGRARRGKVFPQNQPPPTSPPPISRRLPPNAAMGIPDTPAPSKQRKVPSRQSHACTVVRLPILFVVPRNEHADRLSTLP
jgi:hypothetical protein